MRVKLSEKRRGRANPNSGGKRNKRAGLTPAGGTPIPERKDEHKKQNRGEVQTGSYRISLSAP